MTHQRDHISQLEQVEEVIGEREVPQPEHSCVEERWMNGWMDGAYKALQNLSLIFLQLRNTSQSVVTLLNTFKCHISSKIMEMKKFQKINFLDRLVKDEMIQKDNFLSSGK